MKNNVVINEQNRDTKDMRRHKALRNEFEDTQGFAKEVRKA
jgi:hypothetical protein